MLVALLFPVARDALKHVVGDAWAMSTLFAVFAAIAVYARVRARARARDQGPLAGGDRAVLRRGRAARGHREPADSLGGRRACRVVARAGLMLIVYAVYVLLGERESRLLCPSPRYYGPRTLRLLARKTRV